ncbi:TIGR02281 family clan AA aspartic protease [Thalassotalea aquiviva]|uniref:retropepsin-like aspartic protease family protein n=1 Tax=Thalassotalea aquiviva TaxID=3242415 RepID=UPI00352B9C92
MNKFFTRILVIALLVSMSANVYLYRALTTDSSYAVVNKPSLFGPKKHTLEAQATHTNPGQSIKNEGGSAQSKEDPLSVLPPHLPQNVETSGAFEQEQFNLAIEFFHAHEFHNAIDLFDQLQADDKSLSNTLSFRWIELVSQWINTNQLALANTPIELMTRQYPFNEQWALLRIKWLLANKQVLDAYDAYQRLIDNTLDTTKETIWFKQQQELALSEINELKSKKLWLELHTFSQALVAQSDFVPYTLALILASIHTDKFDDAWAYLDLIQYESQFQSEIDHLVLLLQQQEIKGQSIQLAQINEHFLVSSFINNQVDASLLIDTGASLTVISSQFFNRISGLIDYQIGRDIRLNTAGGVQQGYTIMVDKFAIDQFTVNNFEIVVLDLPGFTHADGLLGMNFLKQFRFSIDQEQANLYLAYPL